jgi:ERCC4-related helicase
MALLQLQTIREIADSDVIFRRGEYLQRIGAFALLHEQSGENMYAYEVDGNYGNYITRVELDGGISTSCDCPYPGKGCKHVVAVLLDLFDRSRGAEQTPAPGRTAPVEHLLPEEIRTQALEDRIKRGKNEQFKVIAGDMYKGDHLVTTVKGKQYQVTLHDPASGIGHCSCPDFLCNKLSTCKHILFLCDYFRRQKKFAAKVKAERFPYIDIFWDSESEKIRLFNELDKERIDPQLNELLEQTFDAQQLTRKEELTEFIPYVEKLERYKQVRIQESLMHRLTSAALAFELAVAAEEAAPITFAGLKIQPYKYQEDGIRFGLYKKAVLIGDEMGLGKTLQAIALGILKKEVFGFKSVLVITLSSLKQQWRREIERFSHEQACIIAGSARQRKEQYREDSSLFKITNYEAVLRDVTIISRLKPDLIILDEAQRIKNFETKTAEAVKSLPRQHAIILTGTPLENKLEDIYSLVQFLDPDLLSPLWQFAADHFLLNRGKKGDILGYVNLGSLHQKLQSLVIRRRKEEVLDQLPEVIENNYYIDLHLEQEEIHAGFSRALLPLLKKKFLTQMDLLRIQALLLKMRQVCDSTYLIDKQTNISPKLDELAAILDEIVQQNGRKVVIFSEWTSMTMLIGKHLSRQSIPFVELSGKIPVHKRQALIDEFTENPACKVFLSTDAGGTGLNLQAADCVINFELPWNPAKLNQRIGRVNRIGQTASCVNVVNLIAKYSIEERIMAGIKLKGELFSGVFDGGKDEVMLSRKKREEMVNQLREMLGEEPIFFAGENITQEELAEDTPHFLNPEVLKREDGKNEKGGSVGTEAPDYVGEEQSYDPVEDTPEDEIERAPSEQSAEKMEEVLNQGMGFISGLLEMATGRKLDTAHTDGKMVTVDKQTGEVTLKFTLPKLFLQ